LQFLAFTRNPPVANTVAHGGNLGFMLAASSGNPNRPVTKKITDFHKNTN
jgi:hypothetical protein